MRKGFLYLFTFAVIILSLASCTATKYVPDGSYLLDEVKIHTDQKNVRPSSLRMYVRQNPNAKWFSLIKTQLYVYNLSGRDSTKWGNKFLRRIGDAPVIYSETEAQRSQDEITKAMRNMGYMAATVKRSTKIKKKKIKLYYEVTAGDPYIVNSLKYDIHDPKIADFLKQDSAKSLLKEGMIFDVNVLDAERQRITDKLLRNGYYKFNKDYVGYTADTVRGTYQVDLTLHLHAYRAHVSDSVKAHQQYWINKINFITDYDVLQSSALNSMDINDSLHFKGYPIYYKDKLYLRPKMLTDNLRFAPGDLFNEQDVQQTYSNFGRLSALKYTNIRFLENQVGDTAKLDCYVMLTKSKHKSVAFELEGTNSAGDLGAAASVSFQNRNLFRGSETFMIKFRGAYEVISGLQAGYSNNNYMEYGVETSINFPNFLFPFLSSDYKRKIRATTEFGLQYNYQDRLIINMGYSYHYNSIGGAIINNTIASNSYSIRFNFESAGNIMYALSKATNIRKNNDGEYAILGIPYAQYVKGEFDFSKNIRIDHRNSFAFHIGMGIAVPYGNAKTIPFEKQYFSGGANSVRGWTVRDLGPGSFVRDENTNLLDQSGDIKLDASIEYRSKLFWKFQGAIFVDAGNIWTIRDYDNQPGGVFKFDKFYKQIAVAYGLGLRLDLDFFILRFDGGMKALNPVYEKGKDRYPIIHPKFSRDFAFHFAVGYPF